jgi:type II secretory pathway pseudopilin PulG
VAVAALIISIVAAVAAGSAAFWTRVQALATKQAADAAASAARAAEQSAAASQDGVIEATKARFDATAPRVVVTRLSLEWPPLLCAGSASRFGPLVEAGLWRVLNPEDQIPVTDAVNPEVAVIAGGLITNQGSSVALVNLGRTASIGEWLQEGDVMVFDAADGPAPGERVELSPGDAIGFRIPLLRSASVWVNPPENEPAFASIIVHDPRADGTVDSLHLVSSIRPIIQDPTYPNGVYRLDENAQRSLGVEASERLYRALPDKGPRDLPWRSR